MTAVLSSFLFLVGARRGSAHARPFGARPLVRSHDDIRCTSLAEVQPVSTCGGLARRSIRAPGSSETNGLFGQQCKH